MGMLVNGKWVDDWYDTETTGRRFERVESAFRDWVGGDASRFAAEPGRYHLYVANACPWAHRTVIVRKL